MGLHHGGNIMVVLIAVGHIAVHQRIRVDIGFAAGALQPLAAAYGGEMVGREMQTERVTIACGEQRFDRSVLTLLIIRNIAGDRVVKTFAVGKDAG